MALTDGLAVVDSASPAGGERRVQVTIARGDEPVKAYASDGPAIIYPKAWLADKNVFVAGVACPDLDIGLVGESEVVDHCGQKSPQLRSFDLEKGEWTKYDLSFPLRYGSDLDVASTGSSSILFVGAGEREASSKSAAYLYDLRRGTTTVVPELEGADGYSGCEVEGTTIVLATNPIDPTDIQPTSGVWRINGGHADRLADAPDGQLKLTCTDRGPLLTNPGGTDFTQVGYSNDRVTFSAFSGPKSGAANGIPTTPMQWGGTPLVWVPGDGGFSAWSLESGRWIDSGSSVNGTDPPRLVALYQGQILVLIKTSSQTRISVVGQ